MNAQRHGLHRRALAGLCLIGAAAGLGGCVTVDAPDKPIVINLNINIKQEVLFKLDRASNQVIEKNEGIF